MTLLKSLIISASIVAISACGKDTPKSAAPTASVPAPAPAGNGDPAQMFSTANLTITQGQDYTLVVNPVAVPADKPQVTEFFWYGCPHCQRLEPFIQKWETALPANTTFTRYHVNLGPHTEIHQRMYFAISALHKNKELDQKIFDALGFNPNAFAKPEDAKSFAVNNGIAAADWDKAYNSFDTNTKIADVAAMTKSLGLTGVPTLVVNGKYLVSGETAHTLQVVNKLIEMDRAAAKK